MSTTVAVAGMELTSNHESADSMMESLRPSKDEGSEPRLVKDKGEAVEEPKNGISKAASEMGKKGGEAAAKARKEQAREAKPAAEKAPAEPAKGEAAEDGEAKPAGNPRHDSTARVAQATREAREARQAAEQRSQENAQLKARLERLERGERPEQRQEATQEQHPLAPKAEPEEGDYQSYSDWVRAHHKWTVEDYGRQQTIQAHAHAHASVQRQQLDGFVGGFAKAMQDATDSDPEFLDRVDTVLHGIGHPTRLLAQGSRPGPSNWIADEIMSRPQDAKALIEALADDDDEFQRLSTLSSPREITRALERIAVRLDNAATSGASGKGREVSKARPPFRPVNGSPHIAEPDESSAPFDQVARKRGIKR